jgi:hypothetical protein
VGGANADGFSGFLTPVGKTHSHKSRQGDGGPNRME